MHALSEDVETQKHGYVSISIPEKKVLEKYERIADPNEHQDWKDCFHNQPIRLAAMHMFHPDGPAFQLLKVIWLLFVTTGKEQRVRTKFYTDLRTETRYQLFSYGINAEELPITSTGTIKLKNHLRWIKSRRNVDNARQHEEHNALITGVFHPGVNDVLFNRGGNTDHYGNLEFHQIIESKLDAYLGAIDGTTRTSIRDEVIASVRRRNGRFLQMTKLGWWEEITNPKGITDKVTKALYDLKRKRDALKYCQEEESTNAAAFLNDSKRQKIVQDTSSDGFCGVFARGGCI
jgi:hypothetical protein